MAGPPFAIKKRSPYFWHLRNSLNYGAGSIGSFHIPELRSYRFTKKASNDMDSKVNRGKKTILPAPSDLELTQK